MKELNKYIIPLEKEDILILDERVARDGITNTLDKQLVYLDCSRVINNLRMMQTIGYPYQNHISGYLYLLDKLDEETKEEYKNKLLELHNANIEYEKDNPPVWYDKEKKKKQSKLPRRRNVESKSLFAANTKLTADERINRITAQFGKLTFKIKPK